MKSSILIFLFLFHLPLFGLAPIGEEGKNARFKGRIIRIDEAAQLMRVHVELDRMRFLARGDRVSFWFERDERQVCQGVLKGRTNEYLLFKVPNLLGCREHVPLWMGVFLHFESNDLDKNITSAQELITILLTKRKGLKGRLEVHERALQQLLDEVEDLDVKHNYLREQLGAEKNAELGALHQTHQRRMGEYQQVRQRLHDVIFELERFRVEESNLSWDRWSLDESKHFKK